MPVIPLPALKDNYIWIIPNQNNQNITCIDPGEASPVIDYCKKTKQSVSAIFLTHHHPDHVGGVNDLLATNPLITVYGPIATEMPMVNRPVRPLETISFDTYCFHVLPTPGHTQNHCCYYEPKQEWLFCGDTIFSAGCGRVFDGTVEALFESLLKIKSLPDSTQLFCAHEYTQDNLLFAKQIEPNNQAIIDTLKTIQQTGKHCTLPSTIALEKQINPFLRTDTLSLQDYAHQHGLTAKDELQLFIHLREKKDTFKGGSL